MGERTDWAHDLETELRALGRDLAVPTAPDLTAAVRHRLDRRDVRREHSAGSGVRLPRLRRPSLRRRAAPWSRMSFGSPASS